MVNTTTKHLSNSPTITGLGDGRFVLAWTEWSESVGNDIRAQIFNADGSKAGGEFRVNKTTDHHQSSPTIAALAEKGFVVAWHDNSRTGGDKSFTAVRAQIFKSDGSKSGGEFLVNTTTEKSQLYPTITGLTDGRFVVAWQHEVDVRAQVFNADGSKFGGEFLVNTTAGFPTITGLADGRFIVAWTDVDTSASGVRAQIFNTDGSKSGGEFLVNTTTLEYQRDPKITVLADGRFVVAWTDQGLVGTTPVSDVRAQIFNTDGSKSGGEFLVNTTTLDRQLNPTITALADGRFVVAWIDDPTPGPPTVQGQVFNADGSKSGGEFVVNTAAKVQPSTTITALPDGRFVVAWSDQSKTGRDKLGNEVRGQVFDPREEAIDLDGSDRDDQFVGTRFDDIINGGDGSDWLLGEKGKDLLAGGDRKDKLKGGGGADQFVFGEIGKKHADKLVDFKPGKDLVVLDGDVFTGIGNKLGKTQFEIGKEANDGMDRVIYDKDKGKLSWDGDGKGGDKKVLFAKVDPGLKLSHDDFFMV